VQLAQGHEGGDVKLLIEEPPLQVLPTLAQKIGLNEAIVLQQLHYLGRRSDDERWVAMSVPEWERVFKFWGEATIKRTFAALRAAGLVDRRQPGGTDRRVHYRLNEQTVERLCNASDQCDPIDRITPLPTGSDRPDASDQVDPMSREQQREQQETPLTPPQGGNEEKDWGRILEQLADVVPEMTVKAFRESVSIAGRDGARIVLQASDDTVAGWTRDRFLPDIEAAAARAFGADTVVELPKSETERARETLASRRPPRRSRKGFLG
jgi:DNA-binding transcriptional ArsR family regulator